ncbi:MAG TPA: formyltransferase family protein [Blastocatellia bacterium]|jgi:folate-dependent phosphoribosylglycinamide formyltransferase PurN|nr:formyltransferase family protein [Blastocatellia bacterium]
MSDKMKTLLICHEGASLDREALARWMAAFSDLSGIVLLRENRQRVGRRIKREIKRVGVARFFDVLAFRFYYRLFLARKDRIWEDAKLEELRALYPELRDVDVLVTHSPNSAEAEEFIRRAAPDIVIARCKTLLKESVFSIPSRGTLVMHPGVCPEYRNAHGCFWAMACDDLGNVGMTLLKIDKGVDTGPVYGYYGCEYDEVNESHIVIQHRVVLDNLCELQEKMREIYEGRAAALETGGRPSNTWGQPWLSSYLRWKSRARVRNESKARLSNA